MTTKRKIYEHTWEERNIGRHWSDYGVDFGMEKHTITWTLVEFLDGKYKGHKDIYRRHTRNSITIHSDCFSINDPCIQKKAQQLGIKLV